MTGDTTTPIWLRCIVVLSLAHYHFLLSGGIVAAGEDASLNPLFPHGLSVELVSESEALVPGTTAWIGIYQKIPAGFHTYWKNSGTVGFPTSIDWKLPDGFKAGKVHWPVPVISKMADYRVWGYKKSALIAIPINVPESIQPGSSIRLEAEIQYMCCGIQCFPKFEKLSLSLPVSRSGILGKTKFKHAFDKVRGDFPVRPSGWEISVSEYQEQGNSMIVLTMEWKHPSLPMPDTGNFYFFGYDRFVSSDKNQTLTKRVNGWQLKMSKEEFSPDNPKKLRGILVAEKSWIQSTGSHKRAMEIMAPIHR